MTTFRRFHDGGADFSVFFRCCGGFQRSVDFRQRVPGARFFPVNEINDLQPLPRAPEVSPRECYRS
jgi:hypothetical protein